LASFASAFGHSGRHCCCLCCCWLLLLGCAGGGAVVMAPVMVVRDGVARLHWCWVSWPCGGGEVLMLLSLRWVLGFGGCCWEGLGVEHVCERLEEAALGA
jgi:hypothetical protein